MKGWSPSRTLALVVLAVAVVVALFASSSGSDSTPGTDATPSEDLTGDVAARSADPGPGAADVVHGDEDELEPEPLPVEPTVSGTDGLRPGDAVTVEVTADEGSRIFGVEMRLCSAGTVIRNDGDMLPGTSGRCVSKPFANGGDGFKIVPSDGERTSMTATYVVGTGTDTYPLDDGGTASVTCDHDHPCVLAVKYQIPDGFGFRTYPLTFA